MKVLYTLPILNFKRGGGITSAVGLARALSGKGLKMSIFAPFIKDNSPDIDDLRGVDVRIFPQDFFSKVWTGHSFSLRGALKKEIARFDLIHIHELWHYPHFAAYQAAVRADKPFIVTAHGELEPWRLAEKAFRKKIYFNLFQRKVLENANAIHAITKGEADNISKIIVNQNVFCIPNGLDLEKYDASLIQDKCDNLYPGLKNKKVILFLGRIHPMKGLDILVKAFNSIAEKRDDVRLVIAGPDNGRYKEEVTKMLASGGGEKSTIFTGMITGRTKLAVLSRADIFVLSSYSEVLGISTLEAMALATPVVISKECHFPEVSERGAGRIIETDSKQLFNVLNELIDAPAKRKEMGIMGRKLVEEQYTWDRVADKMLKVYEKVAKLS